MAAGSIRKEFPARGAGNFLLVGRKSELELLAAEYERAHQAQPRVVLLCGPEGIGKTTLLRRFLDEVARQHLLVVGDELEQHVAMGAVRHLLTSLGGPIPPADVVEAGLAVAEHLRASAGSTTVAVVLDDCELIDRPSLEALTVAMRHVEQARVLWLLATSRDPRDVLPAGVGRLLAAGRGVTRELGGLGVEDVVAWSADQDGPGLALVTARQLRDVAAGRPGRISDLVAEVGWHTLRRCLDMAPATRQARTQAAEQLAQLEQPAADFVKAVAVIGDVAEISLAAAVAATPDVATTIDAAVAAGLLDVQAPTVRFADPMQRAAIYHALGVAERSQLHRKAAAATAGDRALGHRLAAVVGGDKAVADDAAARASALLEQGQPVAGARYLARAAQVTPDQQERDRRTLHAVQVLLDHGDVVEAAAVAEGLSADDPASSTVRAEIAAALGTGSVAEALLRAGDPRDPAGAVIRSRLHLLQRDPNAAATAARAAVEEGFGATGQAALAMALAAAGEATAAAKALGSEEPEGGGLAVARGVVEFACGRLHDAVARLRGVAYAGGAQWSVGDRLVALRYLGVSAFLLGDWTAAGAAAGEGLELAAATSRRTEHAGLAAVLRLIAAARGVADEVDVDAPQPVDPASAELLVWADLEMRTGTAQRAPLPPAEELVGCNGSVWPGWQPLYVEALVSDGQLAEAQAVLAQFQAAAGERAWLAATLQRARGAVAAATGAADALEHYQQAIVSLEEMSAVLDASRARVAAGRLLRRNGRRDEAVQMLEGAVDACAALGAAPTHEQAQHELALCGVGRRTTKRGSDLTPQETSVAALAAEGLSSREIANRLTVSVKTVEYHLGNVYAKLDIRSRTQLAVRFRDSL